jgi:ribosome-associated protein
MIKNFQTYAKEFFQCYDFSLMDKITIPYSEFSFSFSRSSGAGGQNINKVNTKVILYWKIDETQSCSLGVIARFKAKYGQFILEDGQVQLVSQEHRTQKGNIDECIEKLHRMLNNVAVPPKVRKATKPKRSAVLKRLQTKKKDSDKKRLRKSDY